MIMTHFEPKQNEGNTLNPGSTPTSYQPNGKISIFYKDIYNISLHENEKKINSTRENQKEKELSDLERTMNCFSIDLNKHVLME